MKKQRILCLDDQVIHVFLNDGEKTGGAAVQLYSWIQGWQSLGQQVIVLNSFKSRNVPGEPEFVESYRPSAGLVGIRWVYYRLPIILRRIKQITPDLIYQSGFAWQSFFYMLYSHWRGISYVVRISNDIYADGRWVKKESNPLKLFLAKRALRMARLLIVQNEYQYQKLTESFPGKKIVKLTNPYQIADSEAHQYIGRSYVAWIGLFQKQKNLGCLLEVAKSCPELLFKVAGEPLYKNDPETETIVSELAELENVIMLGYLKRDEVRDFLSGALCLLNTSHYEGFSNTFLESFAVGTPVVTTANVNPDEVISRHNLGMVAPDHMHLTQVLKELLVNADKLQSLSKNCFSYVRTFHDPTMLAGKFLELFD